MADPYTHMGKQILRDGQHFADTMSPDTARALCLALNDLPTAAMDDEDMAFVMNTLFGDAA